MPTEKTVADWFGKLEQYLSMAANENKAAKRSLEFYQDISRLPFKSLSAKQFNWMVDIRNRTLTYMAFYWEKKREKAKKASSKRDWKVMKSVQPPEPKPTSSVGSAVIKRREKKEYSGLNKDIVREMLANL